MVKMRTQDGGRQDRGRIEGGRGRQTKSGVRLVGFETVAPGGLWKKKNSQQSREAVNEGVMKPCRWGQVIYNE